MSDQKPAEPVPESKPVDAPPPHESDAAEAARAAAERVKAFSVDLSQGFEKAFGEIKDRAGKLLKKGQYTKVRLKFRGRELATVPLTVLVAAEAATFFSGIGLLRFLVVNALGKTFLEVELINEADHVVEAGRKRLLDGELDLALAKFREAIAMDPGHAGAQLNLGVALKLQGKKDEALAAFEKAAQLDPEGETGKEARRQLESLKPRT